MFRVDMRLRPFGTSGPLVDSFAALEDYYQIHGRDWERYAWIARDRSPGTCGRRAADRALATLRVPALLRLSAPWRRCAT